MQIACNMQIARLVQVKKSLHQLSECNYFSTKCGGFAETIQGKIELNRTKTEQYIEGTEQNYVNS